MFVFLQNLHASRTQVFVLLEGRVGVYDVLPSPLSRATRSCWMRVRSKDWWERVVLLEFSDSEWKKNFCMSCQAFVNLCEIMQDIMSPEDATVCVPLQIRVAIALYRLASCGEYRLSKSVWCTQMYSEKFCVHVL